MLDVAEEQAAGSCCRGDGGSMLATVLQQVRSLTWLGCWVHNSPLPDLVNFLSKETPILVMYAGLQSGTPTVVTADCRGETVFYKRKRGWKKMEKRMKRTHTGLH